MQKLIKNQKFLTKNLYLMGQDYKENKGLPGPNRLIKKFEVLSLFGIVLVEHKINSNRIHKISKSLPCLLRIFNFTK